MAIEHTTTVLTIELARLQNLIETETRLRTDLVLELVEGADRTAVMNRAQALGYDLGRAAPRRAGRRQSPPTRSTCSSTR